MLIKKYLLFLTALILILFSGNRAGASHIMGGELTYKYISGNKFELTFAAYRSCVSGSAAMQPTLTYRVFKGADSATFGTYTTKTYNRFFKKVQPVTPNCQLPTGYCIEQYLYKDTLTLGTDSVGYHIVWLANARNNSVITNLNLAGSNPQGMVWYAFVPPVKYKNSSPQFLTVPLPYMCAGTKSLFNMNITDPDNDSLIVSNVRPYSPSNTVQTFPTPTMPPYAVVNYKFGYSVTKPFGSSAAAIKVDPATGEITADSTSQGSYVVAIAIKEYRYDPVLKKTVFMGETRRDLQYLIGSCATSTNKPPKFDADTAGLTRYVDPGSTLCINVSGKDTNTSDTLYMWATGGIFQSNPYAKSPFATFDGDTAKTSVKGKFCWTPSCDQITYSSPYIITINLADNGCNMVQRNYTIYVNPKPILKPPVMYCADITGTSQVKLSFAPTSTPTHFQEYRIYRRTGTSGSFVFMDSLTNVNATNWFDNTASNANSQSYSYYIKTQNSCGLEGLPSDTISSIIITNQVLSDKQVKFSWNKHRNYGNFKYKIFIDEGSGYKLADSTTATTYTVSSCSKTFSFKLRVDNIPGSCASNSNTKGPFTLKDVTAPNIAGKLINATVVKHSEIQLNFKNSDSIDVKKYYIYRSVNGASYTLTDSVAYNKSTSTYTYSDKNVNAFTNYYNYKISVNDSCGNVSGFSSVHGPVQLKATAGNLRSMLDWKKYRGYTPDTVEVQRLVNGNWRTLAKLSAADSFYTDFNVKCGIKYYYRIRSSQATGNMQVSLSDTVEATPFDTISPAKVNVRSASVKNGTSIDLIFDKVTDPDVKKYEIYASTNGGSYSLVATINLPLTSPYTYNHPGLNTLTNTYCYQVLAVDSCGNNKSKTMETHCTVQLTGTALNLSNKIDWTAYKGFTVKNYVVQKRVSNAWTTLSTLGNNIFTYTETNIPCKITQYYRILATEDGGDNASAYSDTIALMPYDTISPARVNVRTVTVKNGTSIEVIFDKVNDADVSRYEIYASTNGGSYALAGTINFPGSSPVTYTHSGLNTLTNTYCYQVLAVDSCGNNKSKTMETHCAVQLSGTALNLANKLDWSAYKGFDVKNYVVQKRVGTSWTTLSTLAPSTFTFTDNNIPCSITQYYRIQSLENGGDNATSLSDTIALTANDTISPARVNVRSASVKNGTSIDLIFDKVSDPDVKKYEIYASTNGGSYSLITTISLPFTSPYTYNHKSLNTLTNTYCYQVLAVDSCGNNKSKTMETHCAVQLTGTALNLSNKLDWTAYKGFTVKNYVVERFENNSWNPIISLKPTDFNYTDAPLQCNVTRFYRIKSVEDGGDAAFSYSDTIALTPWDTIKPEKPLINYVTAVNNNTIYINWNRSTSKDVKKYILYRKAPSAGSFTQLAVLGNDSFYTDNLSSDIDGSYCYAIIAEDSCAANRSPMSVSHCAVYLTTKVNDCKQEIKLKWTPYTTWAEGVDKYNIFRSEQGGSGESLHATVAGGLDSFTDKTNIDYTKTYCYRVQAVRKGSVASVSFSNNTCNKTFAPETPEILYASKLTTSSTNGQLVVKWKNQKNSQYIRHHDLYYKPAASGSVTLLQGNIPAGTDSFVHSGINTQTADHQYYVVSTDSCGTKTAVSETHKSMELKMTVGQLVHNLTWTSYEGWPVRKYIVQTLVGSNWSTVDSLPNTSNTFRRFPAACNSAVYYRILAENNNGTIAVSDTAGGQAIDAIKPNAPVFRNASVVNGSSVKIDFIGADSLDMYAYAIQRASNGGSYSTAGQVLFSTPGATHTFTDNINTLNDYHCYTIISMDSCLNVSVSDTFCTIQLQGKPQNLANRISWKPFKGYTLGSQRVQLYDNNNWTTLTTLSGKDTVYIHQPLQCNVERSYRILAFEQGGSRTTYSDSISLTPFDTVAPPAPGTDYSSVINGSSIYFAWQNAVPKVKLYEVAIKSANSAWKVADTLLMQNEYTFTGLNTMDSTYCVRVIAIDSCEENRSASSVIHCPSQLTGEPLNLANKLTWSAYQGFNAIDQQYIYRWDATNWILLDSVNNITNTYTDTPLACNVQQIYKIAVKGESGKFLSFSDSIALTPFDTIKPPAPVINYASVQPDNSIKLAWTWNPADDVKYFEIWKKSGTTGSFNMLTTVTYDSFYIDNAVNPAKETYAYFIIAVDSCRSLNRSTPSDTDVTMTLTATTGGCKPFIALKWSAYTDLPQGVDAYEIYRSNGSGYSLLTSVAGTIYEFADSTVLEGTNYCYRIIAIDNGSGFSSFSDSFCMSPFVYPAPKVVNLNRVSVTKSGTTDGEIFIDWEMKNPADTMAIGYRIYHATSASGPYAMVMQVNDTNITSYFHTSINTLTSANYYYVVTYNMCSEESDSSGSHIAINLTVNNKNLETELNWTQYVGFTPGRYEVYRSFNKGPFQLYAILNSTDTTFTDSNIRCKQEYTYRVVAYGGINMKLISNSDEETIIGFDTIPATSPDILSASVITTDNGSGMIEITFKGAKEDNRQGYTLYRSDDGGITFTAVKTEMDTSTNVIVHVDNNLNTAAETYSYYIVSLDSCGNISEPSDTHTVIRLVATAQNGMNSLNWSHYVGFKAWNYVIERRSGTIPTWMPIATLPGTINSFDDSMTRCFIQYQYRIRANDGATAYFSHSNTDTATAFETNAPQPPLLKRATVTATGKTDGSVFIEWKASKSRDLAFYNVLRSDDGTNWTQIATRRADDTVYTDNNLNTYEQPYYYHVSGLDSCGNVGEILTDVHKTINLKAVTGNQQIDVSWNAYEGFPVLNYELFKDGNLIATLNNTDFTYTDTMVICKTLYKYEVRANSVDQVANSNADSMDAFDTKPPRPVHMINATVSSPNHEITLQWTQASNFDAKGYRVYRRLGNQVQRTLVFSTDMTGRTSFTDSVAPSAFPYCYEVDVVDFCDNASIPSNKGCIMILNGKADSLIHTINWNPYEDWNQDVDYYNIYKREDNGNWKFIATVDGKTTSYKDRDITDFVKDHCYQVEAIELNGYKATSKSTEICLRQKPIVWVPNAFTPHSSFNLNDHFGPKGMYFDRYEMRIVNRWGEVVYETKNSENWSGLTSGGAAYPEGVYLYQIVVYDYSNTVYIYNGTLTILR